MGHCRGALGTRPRRANRLRKLVHVSSRCKRALSRVSGSVLKRGTLDRPEDVLGDLPVQVTRGLDWAMEIALTGEKCRTCVLWRCRMFAMVGLMLRPNPQRDAPGHGLLPMVSA